MENTLGAFKGPTSIPPFSLAQTGLHFFIPSHGYTIWYHTRETQKSAQSLPQEPQWDKFNADGNLLSLWWQTWSPDHCATTHQCDRSVHTTQSTFRQMPHSYWWGSCMTCATTWHRLLQTGFGLDRIRHPPWTWRLQMLGTHLPDYTHGITSQESIILSWFCYQRVILWPEGQGGSEVKQTLMVMR